MALVRFSYVWSNWSSFLRISLCWEPFSSMVHAFTVFTCQYKSTVFRYLVSLLQQKLVSGIQGLISYLSLLLGIFPVSQILFSRYSTSCFDASGSLLWYASVSATTGVRARGVLISVLLHGLPLHTPWLASRISQPDQQSLSYAIVVSQTTNWIAGSFIPTIGFQTSSWLLWIHRPMLIASRPGDKFSQFFRMPLVRLWTCVVMTCVSSPTSDIMLRDNGSPVMGCDIIIGIAEWWSTGSHCFLLLCPLLSPHEQTVHAHIPHHVTCWPCDLLLVLHVASLSVHVGLNWIYCWNLRLLMDF